MCLTRSKRLRSLHTFDNGIRSHRSCPECCGKEKWRDLPTEKMNHHQPAAWQNDQPRNAPWQGYQEVGASAGDCARLPHRAPRGRLVPRRSGLARRQCGPGGTHAGADGPMRAAVFSSPYRAPLNCSTSSVTPPRRLDLGNRRVCAKLRADGDVCPRRRVSRLSSARACHGE